MQKSLGEALKQKAKTAEEIANTLDDIEEAFFDEIGNTPIDEVPLNANAELLEARKQKWVRLEDAQPLETKIKNLETDRDNLWKTVQSLTKNVNEYASENQKFRREREEWKRKLKELADLLKNRASIFDYQLPLDYDSAVEVATSMEKCFEVLEKKFEELLE